MSKVEVTGRQNPQEVATYLTYLFTYYSAVIRSDPADHCAGGSGADCKLGLTVVRPNLLSAPATHGNWTDGRISRRHSAPSSFLVPFSFAAGYRVEKVLCRAVSVRHAVCVHCILYTVYRRQWHWFV